jgi:hypothetical protein
MALRRAARGTGSSFAFLQQRTAMQALPDLIMILGSIHWVLIDGLALRAYMPERLTFDIDILVHERDSQAVRTAFIASGFVLVGELSIGGFSVRTTTTSAPIDVIIRSDSWLDTALLAPAQDSAGYPVLGRPFLILLKLEAGRTQDLADVQRLLAYTASEERASIRTLIVAEQPELVEDYDSLCILADLEFGAPSPPDNLRP